MSWDNFGNSDFTGMKFDYDALLKNLRDYTNNQLGKSTTLEHWQTALTDEDEEYTSDLSFLNTYGPPFSKPNMIKYICLSPFMGQPVLTTVFNSYNNILQINKLFRDQAINFNTVAKCIAAAVPNISNEDSWSSFGNSDFTGMKFDYDALLKNLRDYTNNQLGKSTTLEHWQTALTDGNEEYTSELSFLNTYGPPFSKPNMIKYICLSPFMGQPVLTTVFNSYNNILQINKLFRDQAINFNTVAKCIAAALPNIPALTSGPTIDEPSNNNYNVVIYGKEYIQEFTVSDTKEVTADTTPSITLTGNLSGNTYTLTIDSNNLIQGETYDITLTPNDGTVDGTAITYTLTVEAALAIDISDISTFIGKNGGELGTAIATKEVTWALTGTHYDKFEIDTGIVSVKSATEPGQYKFIIKATGTTDASKKYSEDAIESAEITVNVLGVPTVTYNDVEASSGDNITITGTLGDTVTSQHTVVMQLWNTTAENAFADIPDNHANWVQRHYFETVDDDDDTFKDYKITYGYWSKSAIATYFPIGTLFKFKLVAFAGSNYDSDTTKLITLIPDTGKTYTIPPINLEKLSIIDHDFATDTRKSLGAAGITVNWNKKDDGSGLLVKNLIIRDTTVSNPIDVDSAATDGFTYYELNPEIPNSAIYKIGYTIYDSDDVNNKVDIPTNDYRALSYVAWNSKFTVTPNGSGGSYTINDSNSSITNSGSIKTYLERGKTYKFSGSTIHHPFYINSRVKSTSDIVGKNYDDNRLLKSGYDVNIISSDDGNKYVFNNEGSYNENIKYFLKDGTYTIKNVPKEHPIALLNNGISGINYSVVNDTPIVIKVSGGQNEASSSGDYFVFKDANDQPLNMGSFRFMRGRTYQFTSNGFNPYHNFRVYSKGSLVGTIPNIGGSLNVTIATDEVEGTGTRDKFYYRCQPHQGMFRNLKLLVKEVDIDSVTYDYDFYYGDVNVTVSDDFDKVSAYCYYHGYMGGQDLFKYGNPVFYGISNGTLTGKGGKYNPIQNASESIYITIPTDFDGDLYYFCTVHSDMKDYFVYAKKPTISSDIPNSLELNLNGVDGNIKTTLIIGTVSIGNMDTGVTPSFNITGTNYEKFEIVNNASDGEDAVWNLQFISNEVAPETYDLTIEVINTLVADSKSGKNTSSININFEVINNLAIICLTTETNINIVNSGGNKYYVFNGKTEYVSDEKYGLFTGNYTFKDIPQEHPMALLNNGKTEKISYSVVDDTPIVIKVSGGQQGSPYSSGDYFVFKDANDQPLNMGSFRFMRGRTYQFTSSGFSSNHNFQVYSKDSLVEDGTISNSGGNFDVKIPDDEVEGTEVRDKFYYRCGPHAGMYRNLKLLVDEVNSATYDFYYGDVNVTVSDDFDKVSAYCYYHRYMGGQDLLQYSLQCQDKDPPVVTIISSATGTTNEEFTVTITSDELLKNELTLAMINVTVNGTVIDENAIKNFNTAPSKKIYTLDITPPINDSGNIVITIDKENLQDALGNKPTENATGSQLFDTKPADLTITGSPNTTVVEDNLYTFTPTASNGIGTVEFSISNKPDWATFEAASGKLSGTPENQHVETYSNITISVNDDRNSSVSLPVFSIQVTNVSIEINEISNQETITTLSPINTNVLYVTANDPIDVAKSFVTLVSSPSTPSDLFKLVIDESDNKKVWLKLKTQITTARRQDAIAITISDTHSTVSSSVFQSDEILIDVSEGTTSEPTQDNLFTVRTEGGRYVIYKNDEEQPQTLKLQQGVYKFNKTANNADKFSLYANSTIVGSETSQIITVNINSLMPVIYYRSSDNTSTGGSIQLLPPWVGDPEQSGAT